jgi:hypothetical protein
MVPRLTVTIALLILFFFPGNANLQCNYFEDDQVRKTCQNNQELLTQNKDPGLNLEISEKVSKLDAQKFAESYNENVSDKLFSKYAENADSFYIEEAWVYIQPPRQSIKIGKQEKLFSPKKGIAEIRTGYKVNSRTKEKFIDIAPKDSCSNQARLINVDEKVKSNISETINRQDSFFIPYNFDKSRTVRVDYILETELEIKDRDLVCTGEEKCRVECQTQSFTSVIEKEKFTDKLKINLLGLDEEDFYIGQSVSKTVFQPRSPGKYFEASLKLGRARLELGKSLEGFDIKGDIQRVIPVYPRNFTDRRLRPDILDVDQQTGNQVVLNNSNNGFCELEFRTVSGFRMEKECGEVYLDEFMSDVESRLVDDSSEISLVLKNRNGDQVEGAKVYLEDGELLGSTNQEGEVIFANDFDDRFISVNVVRRGFVNRSYGVRTEPSYPGEIGLGFLVIILVLLLWINYYLRV